MIKPLTLVTLLLPVLIALPAQAQQPDACTAPLTSLYILQSDTTITDPETLAAVEGWALKGSRYAELIGRPEYTLYGETDGTQEGRRYLLIYPSRVDTDSVIVMVFSDQRLFGRHSDRQLHHHPDCTSGALKRSELETLLEES